MPRHTTLYKLLLNEALSFLIFLYEMVSYLRSTKTLLELHFMSLFTKHIVYELTTQNIPLEFGPQIH